MEKVMKKIISILIAMLLVMSLCAFSVFAQKPVLGGGTFTVTQGSTVEIPVNIKNNPGFWVVRIIATYDADVFEYAGYEDADYPLNFTVSDKSGKATFVMDAQKTGDLTGDGAIFTLKLKAKENVKVGRYEIDLYFDCTNYDCNTVTADIEAPVIAVVCGEHSWHQSGQNSTCTVCGATQQADGEISTDTMEAPVTPPASDDTSSSSDISQSGETVSTPDKTDSSTDKPSGVSTTVIIIICAVALLTIVVMFAIRFIKKK